jgi:hypothetical protein
MNLEKATYKRVDWIQLAQDMIQLRARKNAVAFSNDVCVGLAVKPMDLTRTNASWLARLEGSILYCLDPAPAAVQPKQQTAFIDPPPHKDLYCLVSLPFHGKVIVSTFELVDEFREFQ